MIRFNSAEKSFTLIIYYEDKSKLTVNCQTPNTSLEKKKTNKQTKTSSWFLNINLKK